MYNENSKQEKVGAVEALPFFLRCQKSTHPAQPFLVLMYNVVFLFSSQSST